MSGFLLFECEDTGETVYTIGRSSLAIHFVCSHCPHEHLRRGTIGNVAGLTLGISHLQWARSLSGYTSSWLNDKQRSREESRGDASPLGHATQYREK
jgi:hypothetical protein